MNDDLEQEVVADDTVEVVEDTAAEGSDQATDEEATESPFTDEELTESPGTDEPAVEVVVVTRKRGGRRAASRPAGPPAPVFSAAEAPVADGAAIEIQVPAAAVAAVFQAPQAHTQELRIQVKGGRINAGRRRACIGRGDCQADRRGRC